MHSYGDPKPPITKHGQPIEFLKFTLPERPDFSKEIVENYRKGLSVADIADMLGCSKAKILYTLKRNSVNTRPKIPIRTVDAARYKGKGSCKPFFGFCYFEGRLTKHPVEFPILQMIHQRWQNRASVHYITIELNKKKLKSRTGRSWSWAAVRNIVARFDQKTIILKTGGQYELR